MYDWLARLLPFRFKPRKQVRNMHAFVGNFYACIVTQCIYLITASVPKLILISMDGFRYDYLDMLPANEIENFQYFIKNGVKAESVRNVFPTVTYPNHYTLITGLYPESHGIVHNRFYDPEWKEYFLYDNRRDNFDPIWYDNGAEPVYVTNKKAGWDRSSGSVVWPCGLGKVKGIRPDRIIPNADPFTNINFTKRVDYLIKWFKDNKDPINLGLLYFPEPDEKAHQTGAGSNDVLQLIKTELNYILGYLFKELKENNLFDDTNIILTADHGFTNFTRDKAVVLSDHLDTSLFHVGSQLFENHLTVNVFPAEGQTEKVYQELKKIPNLDVYRKGDDDTVALHYSNNGRIAPIVITAQEGSAIFPDNTSKDNYTTVGVHGYNPIKVEKMRPFFLAVGPAFKKGYKAKTFDSVDIYPLMCYILGITPAPNNGSLENVKGMLLERSIIDSVSQTGVSLLIIFGLSVTLAALYAICACLNARHKPRVLLPSSRFSGVTSLGSPAHQLLNNVDDDDEEF